MAQKGATPSSGSKTSKPGAPAKGKTPGAKPAGKPDRGDQDVHPGLK